MVSICQPHYIPWIGYFEMIDRVDLFIVLDDVDFIKREWKNRNKIRKDATGSETKWLSVPIEHEHHRETWIRDARIADTPWRQRHLDGFQHVYRHAPHFEPAFQLLQDGLEHNVSTLCELNVGLLGRTCDYLGITTPLKLSSSIGCEGRKTEKLLALCRSEGATHYIANNGSAVYLDRKSFDDAGIACAFQDYVHPSYEQFHSATTLPYLSHLSILDLIANHGQDSLEIIRQWRQGRQGRA